MEFREGIILKRELPAEDDSVLTKILNEIPLIVEGVKKDGYLSNRFQPVYVEFSKGKEPGRNSFIMEPINGSGIICRPDTYEMKRNINLIPQHFAINPGTKDDPRTFTEIDATVGNQNYLLEIYSRPKD